MSAKTSKPSKDKSPNKPSMRELAGGKGQGSKKRHLKAARSSVAGKIFKPVVRPLGWFFGKLGRFVPGYFKGAWSEIKQTTWPTRRETVRLTLAVFIFSSVFAIFVATLDFILDKIFRNLILK